MLVVAAACDALKCPSTAATKNRQIETRPKNATLTAFPP